MAELDYRDTDRRRSDREFAAALHGMKLEGSHDGRSGRTYGPRHNHLERMKQRRRQH
jgi:hypothetical protein